MTACILHTDRAFALSGRAERVEASHETAASLHVVHRPGVRAVFG